MAQVENAKDSKQVIVNLTMTVAEARQVIWEGLALVGRWAIFWITTKINYSDLTWGVDKAYKPEISAAARTLLAYWLGEPATLETTRRYGPEVIEGSHYLEDQETDGLMQFMIYMMSGIFFVFIAVWNILQQILANKAGSISLPIVIAINLLIAAVVGLWIFRKTKQQFARWKNSRRGRLGENAVVETIRAAVDNHWTIFRNLHLPDRKDDIDIALVGPGGVWALEVKAFSGSVRSQNGTWERQTKRGWKRLDKIHHNRQPRMPCG